jgi:HSP20 family protein
MQTIEQSIFKTFYGEFSDVKNQLREREAIGGYPLVNIIETDASFFIEMALPGYQKQNLEVKLEHEVLVVSGGSVTKPYRNIMRVLKSDFETPVFERSFILPDHVKEVMAWYDAGVLCIQLLKSTETSIPVDKEVLIQ